jgi:3-oxoacyl-(acyl-carrier-protein) synthase
MVSDGSPVTRPSASGEGLRKACLQIPGIQGRNVPDLIVAHGTGTVMNDAAENEAFESVFGDRVSGIPVTGTKWSVGHTMGASAAVDLVAACEVLRRQSAFRLANTDEVDPSFRGRYLHASAELQEPFHAERVLVTSLGFGGVHAAALVRKAS